MVPANCSPVSVLLEDNEVARYYFSLWINDFFGRSALIANRCGAIMYMKLTSVDHFCLSLSPGILLSRDGQSIPNNDMARISVNDFEVATSETDTSLALRCQWETLQGPDEGRFHYACHVPDGNGPINCPATNPNSIIISGDTITRGWSSHRQDEASGQNFIRIHYIWRREQTAQEGYFSCYSFGTDTNDPAGLYILYPSEWPSLLTVIERDVLYYIIPLLLQSLK